MKRRRLLRLGKWTGLVLCVLVAGVWVGSTSWAAGWGWSNSTTATSLSVGNGAAAVFFGNNEFPPGTAWYGNVSLESAALFLGQPSVHGGFVGFYYAAWEDPRGNYGRTIYVPLWAPFLLLAIPTAFLWWRDRRVRPGFCRCGYDLKGLEGRPCPECGRLQSRAAAQQP